MVCGSGIGMCVAVNRFKSVRGALGFNRKQVRHGVESDRANILCLASDHTNNFKAKGLIKSFLSSNFKKDPEDTRRIKKIEEEI